MPLSSENLTQLAANIRIWGEELGFQQVGITDTGLAVAEDRLNRWLERGYHGEMDYMERHGSMRSRPELLVENTRRVISVRMDYLPDENEKLLDLVEDPALAYVSRYALGRDYHKLMRRRLAQLAKRIEESIGPYGYRVFVDSAPVLEKPLAEKAGLGWIGKHTNLINKQAGSWFFLGEIYTDLQLPINEPAEEHCGSCSACIDICPTSAIVAPFQLDARRCISYLTIELKGSIPEELRPLIGNRIYGCDDCQATCPWNRFARETEEPDFLPRHGLDSSTLLQLFNWSEEQFLKHTEGSAIRRIGYERWSRNLAVAIGNGSASTEALQALEKKEQNASGLVREHIAWARKRLKNRGQTPV
ncbi:MAG: tRNA epoxyqueuosine(34) reductase QueG [Gammaproteobacteria bacterium]